MMVLITDLGYVTSMTQGHMAMEICDGDKKPQHSGRYLGNRSGTVPFGVELCVFIFLSLFNFFKKILFLFSLISISF